jgi:acylphosphatase
MARTTCVFSGHVQGVGFRYTAMNIAQSYDVTGYVRNLADGGVEMVVEGNDAQRKGLIDELREHMGDYIRDVKQSESPGTGEFVRFSIQH